VFNFDSQPRIVGGPYNYGQPGARHALFDAATAADPGASTARDDLRHERTAEHVR
jgi:cytochrome c oxidase subunit 1